uniref:Uncharacterized protein n=1 Tax=Gallus gallus TaxID=9031 RepID=A0A8V0YP26_CHICK
LCTQDGIPTGTQIQLSSSQVELPHGLRKDDTVLNRVQLHCCHGEVLYRDGPLSLSKWGIWTEAHWCPHRGHQEGFALQVQVLQHRLLHDEVAATSTCFVCSNRQVQERLCSAWGQWVCGTQKQPESVQCWKGMIWL